MASSEAARGNAAADSPHDHFLLYDGECVYCRTYVRKCRFRTPSGERLQLVDGRQAPELVEALRRGGCNLEDGMILVLEGRRYQGAEAMTVLGSLAAESGWFNRLTRWLGASPGRARFFYPWFRRLRQAGLRMTGKSGFDD